MSRPVPFHPSTLHHHTTTPCYGIVYSHNPGGNYSEAFHKDPTSGGIAIKITTSSNGLYTGAPQQIFAYSLDGNALWYDLSTVYGDPFSGSHLTVTQDGSPSIDWPNGISPGGSQVKEGVSDRDVVFTACAGSVSVRGRMYRRRVMTDHVSS